MRVAIVIPTGTLVHANFALALAAMTANLSNIDLVFVNPKSSLVASSRNRGARAALECKVDYLLFLDSDMTFPPDTLERLLAAGKDIVGCNYVMRNPPHKSLAVPLGGNASARASGVAEVDALPTGVLLVSAGVFEKLPQPWFATPANAEGDLQGEDYYFCEQARKAGLSIWLDCELSLELIHWGDTGFRWKADGSYDLVEV